MDCSTGRFPTKIQQPLVWVCYRHCKNIPEIRSYRFSMRLGLPTEDCCLTGIQKTAAKSRIFVFGWSSRKQSLNFSHFYRNRQYKKHSCPFLNKQQRSFSEMQKREQMNEMRFSTCPSRIHSFMLAGKALLMQRTLGNCCDC